MLDALKKAGVEEKDLRTTNFSIWPSQQYGPDGTVTGTIYMVDNTVYVTVRDLDGLGDLLDDAISRRREQHQQHPVRRSRQDRRREGSPRQSRGRCEDQAQELADAAGVSLGEIQNINFYDSSPYPYG